MIIMLLFIRDDSSLINDVGWCLFGEINKGQNILLPVKWIVKCDEKRVELLMRFNRYEEKRINLSIK